MDTVEIGETALVGWRAKFADMVAAPVARKTPLSQDTVRVLVAAVLFGLSAYYVAGTVARAARAARDS